MKRARRKPTLAAAYSLSGLAVVLTGLTAGAAWLWRSAEGARGELQIAKGQVEQAFQAEAKAREEVEVARQQLAVAEYGRTMQVAHQEWRDGNLAAARALLAGTRADLREWEWHYVHRLCHADLLTLQHTDLVHAASFSPDGRRVLTASWDGTARVWDAADGTELLVLRGHTNGIMSALFSPDGKRIVTASHDDTVRVWDAATGAKVLIL